MTVSIEEVILTNLVLDGDNFGKKVVAFLDESYFVVEHQRVLYKLIQDFHQKYEAFPTKEALSIELQNLSGVNEDTYVAAGNSIIGMSDKNVAKNEKQLKWLVDKTEKFCQDKALTLAVRRAIKIIDGSDQNLGRGEIPKLLTDALGVSFDTNVGHDYFADAGARWDFLHSDVAKVPYDIEFLNKVTKGGLKPKTLTVYMASTGVGKSLVMCHQAAVNLEMGYNVLYVSGEMSEEELSVRIDANRFQCDLEEMMRLSKDQYLARINSLAQKTTGKLKFKLYPAGAAHAGHIRHLINELRMKQGFMPDILYVDYINLFASSRVKRGQANSYEYIKMVAEDIRGLGIEYDIPVVSATQVNRIGSKASDFGLEEVSESWGLPATADYFFALISDPDLMATNQLIFKQLKNRYNSIVIHNKFVVGIDRSCFRLYDLEESAQTLVEQKKQGQNQALPTPSSNTGYNDAAFDDFK